jgi:hypothetical protein
MPAAATKSGSVGTMPAVSHVGPDPAGGRLSRKQRRQGVFPGTFAATRPSSPTQAA